MTLRRPWRNWSSCRASNATGQMLPKGSIYTLSINLSAKTASRPPSPRYLGPNGLYPFPAQRRPFQRPLRPALLSCLPRWNLPHLYSTITSGECSLSTRQNRSERTESMSDRSTYARHYALHLSDICILATTIRGQQYTLSRTDRTACIAWNSLNRPCIEPYG